MPNRNHLANIGQREAEAGGGRRTVAQGRSSRPCAQTDPPPPHAAEARTGQTRSLVCALVRVRQQQATRFCRRSAKRETRAIARAASGAPQTRASDAKCAVAVARRSREESLAHLRIEPRREHYYNTPPPPPPTLTQLQTKHTAPSRKTTQLPRNNNNSNNNNKPPQGIEKTCNANQRKPNHRPRPQNLRPPRRIDSNLGHFKLDLCVLLASLLRVCRRCLYLCVCVCVFVCVSVRCGPSASVQRRILTQFARVAAVAESGAPHTHLLCAKLISCAHCERKSGPIARAR